MAHGIELSYSQGTEWKLLYNTGSDTINCLTFGPNIKRIQRVLWWQNTNGGNFCHTSMDGGLSLYNAPSGYSFAYPLSAIGVDPKNPLIGYVAIHDGDQALAGLYKSTDGGRTFSQLTGINSLTKYGVTTKYERAFGIAVDPNDSQKVWITLGGVLTAPAHQTQGVALSTDGGTTWAWKDGPNQNYDFLLNIVVDPTNSSRVMYCGVQASLGELRYLVWRSLDGGSSWSPLFQQSWADPNISWMTLGKPSGVAMVTSTKPSSRFGVSVNSGASWTNKTIASLDTGRDFLLAGGPVDFVEASRVNGSDFFLSVQGKGLYLSRDLGNSWSALLTDSDFTGHTIPDPVTIDLLWHCGKQTNNSDGGIFYSDDNGASWTAQRNGGYDTTPFAVGVRSGG